MIRSPRSNAVPVHLTRAERRRLATLTSTGETSARVLKRARILVLLADGWAPSDVPEAAGCGEATVRRTRQRFNEGGLEAALYDRPRPGREPALDDRTQARIVAMVCGPPPDGRARWTVRLVAREAVSRGLVEDVGRETIRIALRDHDLKPWREKNVVRSRTR
jgi:transposase